MSQKQEGYTGPYLLDISTEKTSWTEEEISELKVRFPFLPEDYLEFIRKYDSLGLAWFVFFGSKKSKIIPLREELDYWAQQMRKNYFPFGKDVGGGIFAFNKKGEIIYFSVDDYQWGTPIFIASNLEEFIGTCLLGRRYGEFDSIKNNTFYDFLKDQGWA